MAIAGGVLVLAGCAEQATSPPQTELASSGLPEQAQAPRRIFELRSAVPANGRDDGLLEQAKPGGGGGGGNTGIFFHGGPVLLSPKVSAVYWGTSTIYSGGPTPGATGTGSTDGSLVGFFMRNIGGTPHWNINHTYFNASNVLINNSLTYTGYWAANSTPPASPTDAQIANLITSGFA
ncbi:MAG: hypothetical protein ABI880_16810, partial [Acidobacteriota bacterium]